MTPRTPTQEALERYAARMNAHPSFRGYGIQIQFPDVTRLTLRIDVVPPIMRGGLGDDSVVNGGILSGLCDVLIGCTAGLVDPESRSGTVQLGIRFEQPLRGDSIQGQARLDRATRRLVFASGEISDSNGVVCVRCQGIASLIGGAPH